MKHAFCQSQHDQDKDCDERSGDQCRAGKTLPRGRRNSLTILPMPNRSSGTLGDSGRIRLHAPALEIPSPLAKDEARNLGSTDCIAPFHGRHVDFTSCLSIGVAALEETV